MSPNKISKQALRVSTEEGRKQGWRKCTGSGAKWTYQLATCMHTNARKYEVTAHIQLISDVHWHTHSSIYTKVTTLKRIEVNYRHTQKNKSFSLRLRIKKQNKH